MQRAIIILLINVLATSAHAASRILAQLAIPEPTSYFLIGGTLLGLGILSRKYTKKAGLS